MIVEHVLEDDVEGVVGVDLHLHGAKTKPGGSRSQNLIPLSSPRWLKTQGKSKENAPFMCSTLG